MGKQNDAFTAYLGRAEVLADLYNGCLYQGEEVVQAGNLCEVQQFYQQGLSERVKRPTARRRERDAIRAFWNEKSYVLLAAEAQNQPHLAMPFRCMEYDLAEYARQLRYIRLKSEGKIKTGVEYLSKMGRGTERRGKKCWNERRRTAWNAKGERKYAKAGCQNVREWGHRVYCKTVGAGSI